MADTPTDKQARLASSGVEALIDRLRDEGVATGRAAAQEIEAEARRHATQIMQEAKEHAAQLVAEARKESHALQKGGEEALRIAMRDTVLHLKGQLMEQFNAEVRRLIAVAMDQEEFLKQLIIEVAGRAREQADVGAGQPVKLLLPRALVGLEELRRNPLELSEGSLSHFVLSVAGNVLAEGVTFGVADDDARGIRLHLEGKNVEIELTDEAVNALLLQHLQPRFRAILEGTVK
jgi:V/A-type H+/Na+-transporting ATPase subunit E